MVLDIKRQLRVNFEILQLLLSWTFPQLFAGYDVTFDCSSCWKSCCSLALLQESFRYIGTRPRHRLYQLRYQLNKLSRQGLSRTPMVTLCSKNVVKIFKRQEADLIQFRSSKLRRELFLFLPCFPLRYFDLLSPNFPLVSLTRH